MNIHEYQAKEVLRKFGVAVPSGVAVHNIADIDEALKEFQDGEVIVVKAQIHAGGRGKAGGVKVVKTVAEARKHANEMFGKTLVTHQTGPQGQLVRKIYIEHGSDIKKEYYLSIVIDRSSNQITFMASQEGGVEIEEVAEKNPEKIIKLSVDSAHKMEAFYARKIAFGLGFSGKDVNKVGSFILSLFDSFVASDASQVEINPFVETTDGRFLALDAKINFDDNALFRQKDIASMRDEHEEDPLEIRAAKSELNYVKMDGEIGCMVNGAGLAMATMDIIKLYGAEPANFLDVGGGATKERVTEAFKIILSDENVKGILVNIFGGIMRCDIIAEGIVAAAKEVALEVPLVVRLAGTNFKLGKEILENSGLQIEPAEDLADAANKIVKLVKGEK